MVIRDPRRQTINPQWRPDEPPISALWLDPKSRHDILPLRLARPHIDTTPAVRERVFAILAAIIPDGVNGKVDAGTGRPRLAHWKMLVLGVRPRELNTDDDRLGQPAHRAPAVAG